MTTRRVRSGELLAVAPGAICQDSAGFFLSFGPEIVPNGTHPDYPDVAMIHIRGSLVHHAGDGGDSYEAGFTFHLKPTSWDKLIVFTNPDDGKPPADLVNGVGFKQVPRIPSVDFAQLGSVLIIQTN